MLRPLITLTIEYVLAYIVYRHGKYQKNVLATVLFFLASYQLGELLIHLYQGSSIGLRVAYFSTTLLPPLGILFLEKHMKRKFGYPLFQTIGAVLAIIFALFPHIIGAYSISESGMCLQMSYSDNFIMKFWSAYYQISLLYTMILTLYSMRALKDPIKTRISYRFFIAYASFNLVSMIIVRVMPQYQASFASLMCALALIAAFIFSNIACKLELFNPIKEKISTMRASFLGA